MNYYCRPRVVIHRVRPIQQYDVTLPPVIISHWGPDRRIKGYLEAVMKSSRTLYGVLGLGRQVLGLGPQVLDNWLPHNNFTFCNYSIK